MLVVWPSFGEFLEQFVVSQLRHLAQAVLKQSF
ncbi:hypothetical protein BRAS3843_430021 [Bradyrhizobium sp. STM 3843]|nr:hypothetical protein BRAS3843_430021 [Bradyrhizobium sp. STM 3843]